MNSTRVIATVSFHKYTHARLSSILQPRDVKRHGQLGSGSSIAVDKHEDIILQSGTKSIAWLASLATDGTTRRTIDVVGATLDWFDQTKIALQKWWDFIADLIARTYTFIKTKAEQAYLIMKTMVKSIMNALKTSWSTTKTFVSRIARQVGIVGADEALDAHAEEIIRASPLRKEDVPTCSISENDKGKELSEDADHDICTNSELACDIKVGKDGLYHSTLFETPVNSECSISEASDDDNTIRVCRDEPISQLHTPPDEDQYSDISGQSGGESAEPPPSEPEDKSLSGWASRSWCAVVDVVVSIVTTISQWCTEIVTTTINIPYIMSRFKTSMEFYFTLKRISAEGYIKRAINWIWSWFSSEPIFVDVEVIAQVTKQYRAISDLATYVESIKNPPAIICRRIASRVSVFKSLIRTAILVCPDKTAWLRGLEQQVNQCSGEIIRSASQNSGRIRPVSLAIFGLSGGGKTTATDTIRKNIMSLVKSEFIDKLPAGSKAEEYAKKIFEEHCSMESTFTYQCIKDNIEFADGYNNQMFVVFEELYTSTSGELNCDWSRIFMASIDSATYLMNMAYAKGTMFFDSPFVLATGNSTHVVPFSQPDAYFRRIDLDYVIELPKKMSSRPTGVNDVFKHCMFKMSPEGQAMAQRNIAPNNVAQLYKDIGKSSLAEPITFDELIAIMSRIYIDRYLTADTQSTFNTKYDDSIAKEVLRKMVNLQGVTISTGSLLKNEGLFQASVDKAKDLESQSGAGDGGIKFSRRNRAPRPMKTIKTITDGEHINRLVNDLEHTITGFMDNLHLVGNSTMPHTGAQFQLKINELVNSFYETTIIRQMKPLLVSNKVYKFKGIYHIGTVVVNMAKNLTRLWKIRSERHKPQFLNMFKSFVRILCHYKEAGYNKMSMKHDTEQGRIGIPEYLIEAFGVLPPGLQSYYATRYKFKTHYDTCKAEGTRLYLNAYNKHMVQRHEATKMEGKHSLAAFVVPAKGRRQKGKLNTGVSGARARKYGYQDLETQCGGVKRTDGKDLNFNVEYSMPSFDPDSLPRDYRNVIEQVYGNRFWNFKRGDRFITQQCGIADGNTDCDEFARFASIVGYSMGCIKSRVPAEFPHVISKWVAHRFTSREDRAQAIITLRDFANTKKLHYNHMYILMFFLTCVNVLPTEFQILGPTDKSETTSARALSKLRALLHYVRLIGDYMDLHQNNKDETTITLSGATRKLDFTVVVALLGLLRAETHTRAMKPEYELLKTVTQNAGDIATAIAQLNDTMTSKVHNVIDDTVEITVKHAPSSSTMIQLVKQCAIFIGAAIVGWAIGFLITMMVTLVFGSQRNRGVEAADMLQSLTEQDVMDLNEELDRRGLLLMPTVETQAYKGVQFKPRDKTSTQKPLSAKFKDITKQGGSHFSDVAKKWKDAIFLLVTDDNDVIGHMVALGGKLFAVNTHVIGTRLATRLIRARQKLGAADIMNFPDSCWTVEKTIPERDITIISVKTAAGNPFMYKNLITRTEFDKYQNSVRRPEHIVTYSGQSGEVVIDDVCDFDVTSRIDLNKGNPRAPTLIVNEAYGYNWRGNAQGACGSPMLIQTNTQSIKMIGIHAAGSVKTGVSVGVPLFYDEVADLFDSTTTKGGHMAQCGYTYAFVDEDITSLKFYSYDVDNLRYTTKTITSPTNHTVFVPTPFQEKLFLGGSSKVPADLTVEAYSNALTKKAASLNKIREHPSITELATTHGDIMMDGFLNFKPRFKHKCVTLTPEQAIWGDQDFNIQPYDFSTADGIRLKQMGIRKTELQDPHSASSHRVVALVKEYISHFEATNEFTYQLNYDCLKDELRPIDRVREKKTRLFNITDFVDNVLFKCALGDVMARIGQQFMLTTACCGINPASSFWAVLYNRFKGKMVISKDVSGMDETFRPYIECVLSDWVAQFYPQGSFSAIFARWAVSSCLLAIRFNGGRGHIYGQGNSSGNQGTTFINTCTMHILENMMGYYFCCVNDLDFKTFVANRRLAIYSDDTLSTAPYDWFTMPNIVLAYGLLFGITVTKADKTLVSIYDPPTTIEDVDFLSRGFRNERGVIYAPLNESSLLSQLYFVRMPKAMLGTDHLITQLNINIGNVERELVELVPERADRIAAMINKFILDNKLNTKGVHLVHYDREKRVRNKLAYYA